MSANLASSANVLSDGTLRHENNEKSVLLLEGDAFAVSHDGIARTGYHLAFGRYPAHTSYNSLALPPLAIEELYDLKHARKSFILRQCLEPSCEEGMRHGHENLDPADGGAENILGKQAVGIAPLGDALACFQIQEIEEEGTLFDSSAGTGATTWEASVAMGLFFLSNPSLLRGNVLELGCGVGFGSILSHMGSHLTERETANSVMGQRPPVESVTLTDGNGRVLEQCRQNLCLALNSVERQNNLPPFHVKRLVWDDAALEGKQYDTVLACDVAYLHTHVDSLVHAMKTLVRDGGNVHIFGPYNRGALQEICRSLQRDECFEVVLDFIEIERYRLKPQNSAGAPRASNTFEDRNAYQSKSTATFLHATAHKHISPIRKANQEVCVINDID